MRCHALLILLPLLIACQKQENPREMHLKPGSQNTFFAVLGETPLTVDQPATAEEPAFKYRVHASPNKGISIGAAVGGEGQGDLSETQFFTPASITKVVTASVALELLGGDFHFTTRISFLNLGDGRAQDLSVRADGDPLVDRERFRHIALELKKRGITRLTGRFNLVSTDPRKDLSYPAFGLDKEDYWSCYGSRAQNFNLQRNCSSVQIGDWGQARWTDGAITAPLSFAADRKDGARVSVDYDLDPADRSVRGYLFHSTPAKGAGKGLPVVDVKSWYGNALLAELKRQKIEVSEVSVSRDLPLAANESFEIHSAPLSELAQMMNKVSDNFIAEGLYKAAAAAGTEKNINDAAAGVVRARIGEWLKATRGENLAKELVLHDGAGLSRANKVTPRAFLSLLKAFTKEAWFPTLWDSLPIAGVDGTLRGRMGSSAAGKLVRAKTGTLKGAYQLAGYIPKLAADGKTITEYIPFVLLTATTPKNSGSARAFQDKLLGELAEQINKRK